MQSQNDKAIFVVGPTGVGKTEVGFKVASLLKGEIVSADSRQIYRFMDIGTDKPPDEYLQKIKHHFISVLEPDTDYNAGRYGNEARDVIHQLVKDGIPPVVVGGSGLYVKSILEGLFDEPAKDATIRDKLKIEADTVGLKTLHDRLKSVDAVFAEKVSVNDEQRIIRGLEVFEITGKPLSEHWQNNTINLKFKPFIFGLQLPREEVYGRINARVDIMIEKGLVQEVESLRNMNLLSENNAAKTFGYREVMHYLNGELEYDKMIDLVKKETRNFAKRQLTWFRKLGGIQWVDMTPGIDSVVQKIVDSYLT